ncbi:MAG: VIT domain-containing protein [Planctomycetota bacterium]
MNNAKLHELIAGYYRCDLDDTGQAALEKALRESAMARELFVELAFEEVSLTELLGQPVPEVPAPVSDSGRRLGWLFGLGAAAALIFAILYLVFLRDDSPRRWAEILDGRCARLSTEGALEDVDDLERDEIYVGRGAAQILLAGSDIRLQDATFSLGTETDAGRARIRLIDGEARFTVPASAKGLIVETPVGELRDIGTEFEVTVNGQEIDVRSASLGALVLATVLQGAVEFTPALAARTQELRPEMGRLELREDGRIGQITDRQGVGQVRPIGESRWLLASERRPLDPGDWLQTGSRGANALSGRLANEASFTMGPATQVEVKEGNRVRLLRGEIEIRCPDGVSVTVDGPGEMTIRAQGSHVYAVRDGELRRLTEPPRWLIGYRNDESTDALGSLLANVDGRNVPLTMGYHKVQVDIRDQIARTTIEESFVNHTGTRLEGVFYFPLPAEASISGFAMWINGQKVPADIVEKERAREIYETILREKRDPGLLEWTGGNIFKARVFPIDGEKRIEIQYTEVLPKQGDSYRYTYGLRSELTRDTPLERLELTVTISSEEPLAEVISTTHPLRLRTTPHSARGEYSAEEIIPERDFELSIRTEPSDTAIRVIPHRRTVDGYFLMMLDAPDVTGAAATNAPLDLILLADTSGSMDDEARRNQIRFLEALLGSLGEKDRFNLATTDTETRWAFEESVRKTAESVERALRFVEERPALGWSDLRPAFTAAFSRAGAETDIAYVGDGVPTRGDTDGSALLGDLRSAHSDRGAVHAIACSSSYDALVLRGLSRLGAGSWRRIGAGTDAARAASSLVQELSLPALHDLELEIVGVEVAALHPESLPNLAPGMQQIIVGRFDPAQGDARGTVRVRGLRQGEEVSFEAPFILAEADRANSFIPRLWARNRLDHLLEQGSSPENRDHIIALSEDFQIITPFTSFLVLESEADRQRFQVERTFRMRDGEEFFAEGRDQADFKLRKEQLELAKRWRFETRQNVINGLRLTIQAPPPGLISPERSTRWNAPIGGVGGGGGGPVLRGKALRSGRERFAGRSGDDESWYAQDFDLEVDFRRSYDDGSNAFEPTFELANEAYLPMRQQYGYTGPSDSVPAKLGKLIAGPGGPATPGPMSGAVGVVDKFVEGNGYFRLDDARQAASSDILGLFPIPPSRDPSFGLTNPPVEVPETWSAEVASLVAGLDRQAWLANHEGAIRMISTEVLSDEVRASQGAALPSELLVSGDAWWMLNRSRAGGEGSFRWLRGDVRGEGHESWRFVGLREREAGDEGAWLSPIPWLFQPLRQLASLRLARQTRTDEKVTLTFFEVNGEANRIELDLSPDGDIVLEQRQYRSDSLSYRVVFDELFDAAGRRWPARLRTFDSEGALIVEKRVEVEAIDDATFTASFDRELERLGDAIVLGPELPTSLAAREAFAEDRATVQDLLIAIANLAAQQRFEEAQPFVTALAERVADRRGGLRLIAQIEVARRRLEAAQQRALEMADGLVAEPRSAELAAASDLLSRIGSALAASDRLELLRRMEPVFLRQGGWQAEKSLLTQRLSLLDQLARVEEAFELAVSMVERFPNQTDLLTGLARRNAQRGEVDRAVTDLSTALSANADWDANERLALRRTIAEILVEADRYDDAAEAYAALIEALPEAGIANEIDRYLTVLTQLDRLARVDELIRSWLITAAESDELSELEESRLDAAVRHSVGTGWSLYRYGRFNDRYAEALRTALLGTLWKEHGDLVFRTPLGRWDFRRSLLGEELETNVYDALVAKLDEGSLERIGEIIGSLQAAGGYSPKSGQPTWHDVFSRLIARWSREDLGGRVRIQSILGSCTDRDQKRAFWRTVLGESELTEQKELAQVNLFQVLLGDPWSLEHQKEAFALLGSMAAWSTDESSAVVAWHSRLNTLVSWLPAARVEAEIAADPESSEWTRRELAQQRQERLAEARRALREDLKVLERGLDERLLRPWVAAERWGLALAVREDAERLAAEALDFVETLWGPVSSEELSGLAFRQLLERSLAAACYFAALSGEGSESAQELESFLIEHDDPRAGIEGEPDARGWRIVLQMAQARVAELRSLLGEWIGDDVGFPEAIWARWRAPLLAEDGEFEAAIALLEQAEARDRLDAEDYRLLAGWQTVLGNREAERRAMRESFAARGVGDLSSELQGLLPRFQRSGENVPAEMDEDIFIRFEVLFSKAPQPERYIWLLQRYYDATHDFRLLTALPRAVIGATPTMIYDWVRDLDRVLSKVQEEATLDSILDVIDTLRANGPSATDARSLLLLELAVAWRGTQQASGTEGFVHRFQSALEGSWLGEWTEGERRQMAELLAGLGPIRSEGFSTERLFHSLAELRRGAGRGSLERVWIAKAQAEVAWKYDRREDAIEGLVSAIETYRSQNDSGMHDSARAVLVRADQMNRELGRYLASEDLWTVELERAENEAQRWYVRERLLDLAPAALRGDGRLSFGAGRELYIAARDALESRLAKRTSESHSNQLIGILGELMTVASEKLGRETVEKDVTDFAFRKLPRVLSLYQYRGVRQPVSTVRSLLEKLVGEREALRFLVVQAETEPEWLELQRQDLWGREGRNFSRLVSDVNPKDELGDRALSIVLGELEKGLRSRVWQDRSAFRRQSGHFWSDRREDFIALALEVGEAVSRSEAHLLFVAEYLWEDLGALAEAIDLLEKARARSGLSLQGRRQLTSYLIHVKRWTDALSLGVALLKEMPDDLELWGWLIIADHGAHGSAVAKRRLEQAEKHFRAEGKGRWNETVAASLGDRALQIGALEKAIALVEEAIRLHTREQDRRGTGDAQLVEYYRTLAKANSQAGHLKEAIDAVAGALLVWRPSQTERQHDLNLLQNVMTASKALDEFLGELDEEVAESGLENPILRRAAGEALLKQDRVEAAIVQLEKAFAVVPEDKELAKQLVAAYDAAGLKERAAARLWEAAAGSRSQTELFVDLGNRFAALGEPEQAERAYTNVVELLPNESKGHELLAKVRESQERYLDAAAQWRAVTEIRTKEPTGRVGTARNLIRAGRAGEAREVLDDVLSQSWPERFQSEIEEARALRKQINE